tara:strand:+ start:630 stop:764 length:135 start_codon:yes stop_codon:yes gene_type:complete
MIKSFSIFILLLYWSVILLAPVISKEIKAENMKKLILPLKKPIN